MLSILKIRKLCEQENTGGGTKHTKLLWQFDFLTSGHHRLCKPKSKFSVYTLMNHYVYSDAEALIPASISVQKSIDICA